jgi:hypothetical protein
LVFQPKSLGTLKLKRRLPTDDDLKLLLDIDRPDKLLHLGIWDCYVSEDAPEAFLN